MVVIFNLFDVPVTAYPAGYTDNQRRTAATPRHWSLAAATRGLSGATAADPAAATLSAGVEWIAFTLLIAPAT
jgi:hypothetical protein